VIINILIIVVERVLFIHELLFPSSFPSKERERVREIYERFIVKSVKSAERCEMQYLCDYKSERADRPFRIFYIRAYLQSINGLVVGSDCQVTLAVLNRSQCVPAHADATCMRVTRVARIIEFCQRDVTKRNIVSKLGWIRMLIIHPGTLKYSNVIPIA